MSGRGAAPLAEGPGFGAIGRAGTPIHTAPAGILLRVTIAPAPVIAPAPTTLGATRTVPLPMKAPRPIAVGHFAFPSKFAVIVPAPMFASSPTVASPR